MIFGPWDSPGPQLPTGQGSLSVCKHLSRQAATDNNKPPVELHIARLAWAARGPIAWLDCWRRSSANLPCEERGKAAPASKTTSQEVLRGSQRPRYTHAVISNNFKNGKSISSTAAALVCGKHPCV